MNWIHLNVNGKVSFVFGALALFFILATMSAHELNDGHPGLVDYIVSNAASALTPENNPSDTPEMSAGGIFPLSEKEEKNILVFVAFGLAFLSLVFSMIAERAKESTLYYGGGVLAAFNALIFISVPVTVVLVVPTLLALWYLHRANGKPNNNKLGDAKDARQL